MLQMTETVIAKDQLFNEFIALKKWLTEYWGFLEKLPLDIFVEPEHLVTYLRDQHQKLIDSKVRLKILDMVAALLNFSLQRIRTPRLTFQVPEIIPVGISAPTEYNEIALLSAQAKHVENSLQQIVDQIYFLSRHLPQDSSERISPLIKTIGALFKSIIRQDGDDLKVQLNQINVLTSSKESAVLLQEIGKITRDIYNSLQDLSTNLDTDDIKHVTDEMPDAVQKLNSVIQRLEDAANDNLEFLEKLLQQSADNIKLTEELKVAFDEFNGHLLNLQKKYPKLKAEIGVLTEKLEQDLNSRVDNLLNTFHANENLFLTIMTNQGFQDLTGQTLKKIIDFIEHLELRLLDLIKKYSPTPTSTAAPVKKEQPASYITRVDTGSEGETVELHGPDESDTKKSTQNDVDSLLAQLGF